MAILEVNNIKKNFGKVEVLKNISFSLEKGEVLSIIGSSGSGKTTLLRCLNFLETPDSGIISVDGKVLFDDKSDHLLTDEEIRENRLHFGLVFQSFNLFPQYNVLNNVTLAPTLLKKGTPEEIDAKARELIEKVGLTEKIENYPCELSGGQKVRVMLSLILVSRPKFLLLDEPFGDLDPVTLRDVTNSLKKISKEYGITIVMISHNTDFIKELSNRALFMDDGKIIDDSEDIDEIVDNFIDFCHADYLKGDC